MPQRLDRPTGAGFGAAVLGRFLTGVADRFNQKREQEREDELLAGKQEREKELIGVRTEARTSLQEMINAFQVKRDEAAQAYRTGEARRAEQADLESDKILEGIKQTGRKELQQMRIQAGKDAKQIGAEVTPGKVMLDMNRLYGDQLEIDEKRKASRLHANEGIPIPVAVGLVKGDKIAGELLSGDLKNDLDRFNRKPNEKFISGSDLLDIFAQEGVPLGGAIPGFDEGRTYSAKEAISMIVASQEEPVAFAGEGDNIKGIIDAVYALLEQSHDPGAEREEIGPGRAFMRGAGKLIPGSPAAAGGMGAQLRRAISGK